MVAVENAIGSPFDLSFMKPEILNEDATEKRSNNKKVLIIRKLF